MVAIELEVMAKKVDRFGWERDRNTAAHDRLMVDWMDVLQEYPLAEVRSACRAWNLAHPRKMPNEGDILSLIMSDRAGRVAMLPKLPEPTPDRVPVSAEAAAEILASAGFRPRRMNTGEGE